MGPTELRVYDSGANAAGFYLYGCDFHPFANRLAVLYSDDGPIYWSGITLPIKKDANGCMGVGEYEGVEVEAGRCYWLKQENPVSWITNPYEVLVTCE